MLYPEVPSPGVLFPKVLFPKAVSAVARHGVRGDREVRRRREQADRDADDGTSGVRRGDLP
ncbi:hypothetical protein Pth03_00700 [Planotetraspora thailandica]|uniref:Uncharacterized protein n=1 Tax=Planotetraspora thailandica TaxID=487172 RepID=A0A8J3XTK4_9ACTN|nr:hypothetical protein Pth03_00700 [Planotetraspora thailandica]